LESVHSKVSSFTMTVKVTQMSVIPFLKNNLLMMKLMLNVLSGDDDNIQ
jgi:hypothetical protein